MANTTKKKQINEYLNKLTVNDLDRLCKRYLIPHQGRKIAKIERILKYINNAEKEEQIYSYLLFTKPDVIEAVNNSFMMGKNATTTTKGKNSIKKKDGITSNTKKKVKVYDEDHDFSSCICGGMRRSVSNKNNVVQCVECHRSQHVSCYLQNSNIPENLRECKIKCAVCRFKVLDPFYPLLNVLWMKNLTVNSEKLVLDTEDLKHWRTENKEVLIFCINIDRHNLEKATLKQEWPRTFTVKINGCILEKIPEPTWEHKRRDSPLKITHSLKAGSNNIDINMTNYENPKIFVIAFLLCKTESEENIIERVIMNSSLNFKDAKQRIISILSKNDDVDDEVMCMEVNRKINLNCPLTLDRILVPCRGNNCSHIQCFDLKSFINITKKTKAFNNRWKCPICSFFLRPKDLVIDTFITYALSQVPKDIKEIEISKDGKIITNATIQISETKRQAAPRANVSKNTTSKRKDYEDRCKDNPKTKKAATQAAPSKASEDIIIIDSDDEDDMTLQTCTNVDTKSNTESFKDETDVILITDDSESGITEESDLEFNSELNENKIENNAHINNKYDEQCLFQITGGNVETTRKDDMYTRLCNKEKDDRYKTMKRPRCENNTSSIRNKEKEQKKMIENKRKNEKNNKIENENVTIRTCKANAVVDASNIVNEEYICRNSSNKLRNVKHKKESKKKEEKTDIEINIDDSCLKNVDNDIWNHFYDENCRMYPMGSNEFSNVSSCEQCINTHPNTQITYCSHHSKIHYTCPNVYYSIHRINTITHHSKLMELNVSRNISSMYITEPMDINPITSVIRDIDISAYEQIKNKNTMSTKYFNDNILTEYMWTKQQELQTNRENIPLCLPPLINSTVYNTKKLTGEAYLFANTVDDEKNESLKEKKDYCINHNTSNTQINLLPYEINSGVTTQPTLLLENVSNAQVIEPMFQQNKNKIQEAKPLKRKMEKKLLMECNVNSSPKNIPKKNDNTFFTEKKHIKNIEKDNDDWSFLNKKIGDCNEKILNNLCDLINDNFLQKIRKNIEQQYNEAQSKGESKNKLKIFQSLLKRLNEEGIIEVLKKMTRQYIKENNTKSNITSFFDAATNKENEIMHTQICEKKKKKKNAFLLNEAEEMTNTQNYERKSIKIGNTNVSFHEQNEKDGICIYIGSDTEDENNKIGQGNYENTKINEKKGKSEQSINLRSRKQSGNYFPQTFIQESWSESILDKGLERNIANITSTLQNKEIFFLREEVKEEDKDETEEKINKYKNKQNKEEKGNAKGKEENKEAKIKEKKKEKEMNKSSSFFPMQILSSINCNKKKFSKNTKNILFNRLSNQQIIESLDIDYKNDEKNKKQITEKQWKKIEKHFYEPGCNDTLIRKKKENTSSVINIKNCDSGDDYNDDNSDDDDDNNDDNDNGDNDNDDNTCDGNDTDDCDRKNYYKENKNDIGENNNKENYKNENNDKIKNILKHFFHEDNIKINNQSLISEYENLLKTNNTVLSNVLLTISNNLSDDMEAFLNLYGDYENSIRYYKNKREKNINEKTENEKIINMHSENKKERKQLIPVDEYDESKCAYSKEFFNDDFFK